MRLEKIIARGVTFILITFLTSGITRAEPEKNPLLSEPEIVNVGVLAPLGERQAIAQWHPMMRWLERQIPGYYFRLQPYNLEQLAVAVSQHKLDFVLTNPGQSVELSHKYIVTWLATLKSAQFKGSTKTIGSVFIVNADSEYDEISQLEHKKIAAISEKAFGGYLAFVHEAKVQGNNINRLFSNMVYTGFPLDNLVIELIINQVDAAIVPVCHLEKMTKEGLITPTQFRVLNDKTPPGFDCLASTSLYPNWSFAKTKKVSQPLAKSVTLALLALPENHIAAIAANSIGWGAAASKLKINIVLKELDIHPIQIPLPQKAIKWLIENRIIASVIVLIFILLNIYHFFLEYRFSRSKRLVIVTQNQLNEKIAMLEHAQRVAVVGELGSSIAHEMNQPLSAIRSYAEGAFIRADKGFPPEDIKPILSKIQQQVIKADTIIQRLRLLIKKRIVEKQPSRLEPIIEEVFQLLEHYSVDHKIKLTITGQSREIYIDQVGITQLLLNIIKNGIESCADLHQPNHEATIDVQLYYLENDVKITITDNGAGLKKSLKTVQSAFYSTKENGMGLGLAICRGIIESHHGSFTMTDIKPTGCQVGITLPLDQGT